MSKFASLIFAVVLLAGIEAHAAAVRLNVQPQVYVKGPKLYLGDVAYVEGPQAAALTELELGYAARPGQARTLQAAFIRSKVEQWGVASLEVTGADMVRATTNHLELRGELIEQDLRRFIAAAMPWDSEEAVIEVVAPNIDMVLPDGEVDIVWRPTPDYAFLGPGAIQGEIQVDGETQRTVNCRLRIEAYGPVVVAATDVHRGELVTMQDVRIERQALSKAPQLALQSPGAVAGKVATRTFFPGQVLTTRHVEERTVVKRRQIVTVETKVGALVVQSQARALGDAKVGEVVVCANDETKQEFTGVVRADGVVIVD